MFNMIDMGARIVVRDYENAETQRMEDALESMEYRKDDRVQILEPRSNVSILLRNLINGHCYFHEYW